MELWFNPTGNNEEEPVGMEYHYDHPHSPITHDPPIPRASRVKLVPMRPVIEYTGPVWQKRVRQSTPGSSSKSKITPTTSSKASPPSETTTTTTTMKQNGMGGGGGGQVESSNKTVSPPLPPIKSPTDDPTIQSSENVSDPPGPPGQSPSSSSVSGTEEVIPRPTLIRDDISATRIKITEKVMREERELLAKKMTAKTPPPVGNSEESQRTQGKPVVYSHLVPAIGRANGSGTGAPPIFEDQVIDNPPPLPPPAPPSRPSPSSIHFPSSDHPTNDWSQHYAPPPPPPSQPVSAAPPPAKRPLVPIGQIAPSHYPPPGRTNIDGCGCPSCMPPGAAGNTNVHSNPSTHHHHHHHPIRYSGIPGGAIPNGIPLNNAHHQHHHHHRHRHHPPPPSHHHPGHPTSPIPMVPSHEIVGESPRLVQNPLHSHPPHHHAHSRVTHFHLRSQQSPRPSPSSSSSKARYRSPELANTPHSFAYSSHFRKRSSSEDSHSLSHHPHHPHPHSHSHSHHHHRHSPKTRGYAFSQKSWMNCYLNDLEKRAYEAEQDGDEPFYTLDFRQWFRDAWKAAEREVQKHMDYEREREREQRSDPSSDRFFEGGGTTSAAGTTTTTTTATQES